jgi:hypothetical protein
MVHALRESYYVHGTPFQLETRGGWIAAAMSPALPSVLPPGGVTEHELGYAATHAGRAFTLNGRLDLGYPDVLRDGTPLAVVRDYKTTSSMQYAKLEREALLGHSQAPLYGLMYMQALGVRWAWLGWVYVGTRSSLGLPPWPEPELRTSDHLISYAEAEERVHLRMVPAASAMLELRDAFAAGTPVDAFPKNTTACFKYNKRCPYWARCQPEKRKAMSSLFLAAVGAKVAPQPAPPAPAATPPAPEPQTPPAGATQGVGNAPLPVAPAINPPEEPGTPTSKTKGKAPAIVAARARRHPSRCRGGRATARLGARAQSRDAAWLDCASAQSARLCTSSVRSAPLS